MEAVYCLCGQVYDPNVFMIQCDTCKDWFHGSCCNFQEYTAVEIEKFHCPRCVPTYGPSVYKPYRNCHRHDYWDENAATKAVQTGTPVFIRELRARHFSSEGEVVLHMRGQQLNETFLQQQGFNNPIIIDSKDGLGMTVPPDNFSLYDVEACIGGDWEMDVIDVTRQTDIRMKLTDFVAYFNSLNRTRIFNVISLEFTDTELSRLVEAPLIARKLDWVNCVWPRDYHIVKPQVQKYCLMSVKDSYTDFHIDFGGTSVWYHVLRGEKTFYFIRPTIANLTLYQQWMTSTNQSETFFGDQVDQCYKCTLRQGQTMLIPTGWIHAVLTPIDSLVFGGNFLHSLNIPMQLQIYEIEKKIKTVEKFRYPHFETINWLAGQKLLEEMKELNMQEKKCPNALLLGLKMLLTVLKQWNTEKDYNTTTRDQIPKTVVTTKLLKDISREIRHTERFLNALHPPKPERESKRKRKRPMNKDFVNYTFPSKESLSTPEILKPEVSKPPPIRLTLPKPSVYPYNRAMMLPHTLSPVQQKWTNDKCDESEQTTSVYQGGAVLKFKLGSKDISSEHDSDIRIDLTTDHWMLPNSSKSVYDFSDDNDRDDDEFGLSIDENAKKSIKSRSGDSLKIKVPAAWSAKNKSEDRKAGAPENGIESLLKASVLTNKIIGERAGRTSPSTEDAIAGMLSISQMYIQPGKGSARAPRKYRSSSRPPPDEENIRNVHQDEDYIYPSLDNSDDEDFHIFKPRGRSKVDEAWNPKARVGPLLPKMNRPAREGTKKQAVEKVLEAAAAKRATESPEKSPKRQYRRKKVKPKTIVKPISNLGSSSNLTMPSSSSHLPSTSTPIVTPPKPRKGMKTVKQRLGKILKIHKMIY